MTIANLFVAADAVHLLADSAFFDPAGEPFAYCRKIGLSSRHRLAVMACGLAPTDVAEMIEDWLDGWPDQEAAMRAMPSLLRAVIERQREMPAVERDAFGDAQSSTVCLTIALYSLARRQPEGYVMISRPRPHLPDIAPMRLHGARRSIMPVLPAAQCPGVDLEPETDGMALCRAQLAAGGKVGGQVDLATVDRDGARIRAIGNLDEPVIAYRPIGDGTTPLRAMRDAWRRLSGH